MEHRQADDKPNLTSNDEKWRAVVTRDSASDGVFVYAVRSTGIYCKPSCPARRPGRQQVRFFSAPHDAERAGFRACIRCKPKQVRTSAQTELADRLCKYIEQNLDKKITLANLSAQTRISPYHLQRTFKKMVGISPRQYAEALRLAKMKRSLRNGETVTRALYGAGFSSRSRLYEKAQVRFGMSPGAIRRGGLGMRIEYAAVEVPLGRLLVAVTERGVCAVCIGDTVSEVEAALSEDYPFAEKHRTDQGLRDWIRAFANYLAGRSTHLNLPIDVQATAFQWKVWKEIQSVPYGETTSYSKIAAAIGSPEAVRAVANACARNPVALIVPCHRVIGKDRKLHGYRWGNERKEALLRLERNKDENTT